MNVHDLIFTVGTIAVTVSLVPGLRDKIHTPLATATTLCGVIGAFTINYATMHYFFTAAICAVQTALWGVIARQSRKRGERVIRWPKTVKSTVWRTK